MSDQPTTAPGTQRTKPRTLIPTNPFIEFKEEDLNQSVPDRFEKQVKAYPQRTAIKTDRHELTYAELNRAANRLAQTILAQRGSSVEPVAFLLEHGGPQIVAILGILKAGKIYAALDNAYFPQASLTALIEDVQPALIVTDNVHMAMALELSQGKLPIINLDILPASVGDDDPRLPLPPDNPALILFTSGSTGKPKGVFHSHRNTLHYTRNATNGMHVCKEDRLSLLASTSFAGSLGSIFQALLNGAALLPFNLKAHGVGNLARWLIEEKITIYGSVTSVFRHLIGTLAGGEAFPSVRIVTLGGEGVSCNDVDDYKKHFLPSCLLASGLAATEILTVVGHFLDRQTTLDSIWVPIGYPSPGSEILLVDETGAEVAAGEVGCIAVRSKYLALGYWRDPERTRTAFQTDASTGMRTYNLGDMALRRPDGKLEYRGRQDFQVKVRGHRINVAEIETVLAKAEGVKQAVVVGREEESGDCRLVAYIIPATAPPPNVSDLRRALREKLAGFMVPSAFVFLDAFPLTPTGKVDRKVLPAPDTSRPNLTNPYEMARNPLQQQMIEIWENCLNIRPVGLTDNFFELGGDSLLAADMLAEVEQAVGSRVSPEVMLTGATVQLLSKQVVRGNRAHAKLIVEIQPASRQRLFFAHGDFNSGGLFCLNLARCLGPDMGFYALQPHGLAGTLVPRTIQEMAADFLQGIRRIQPEGPYLLAGHCNGGLIAFEMARQLHAVGQQVTTVLIAPPRMLRYTHPPELPLGNPVTLEQKAEKRWAILNQIYAQACLDYNVQPLAGRLIVIEPQEGMVDIPLESVNFLDVDRLRDQTAGEVDWHDAASQVDSHKLPGNHFTVATRHVQTLADCLKDAFKL